MNLASLLRSLPADPRVVISGNHAVPFHTLGLVDQALAPAEQDGPGPVPPAERETIRTKVEAMLDAVAALDPEMAEELR